jgi:uncharacterized YigZ family protein
MEQLYRIRTEGEALFKDRGSKFLAFALPVKTQEEMTVRLQEIKKRFHDARHHCHAYRLGAYGETTYANDDGEPSHSAGTPILSAIRSGSVTDALVVVVRYFGGTKLGVRGLIEAYRTSAEEALAACQKEAVVHRTFFELVYGYERTSELNRIMHPFAIEQVAASYTEVCELRYAIAEEDFPRLEEMLRNAQFEIKVLEEENHE